MPSLVIPRKLITEKLLKIPNITKEMIRYFFGMILLSDGSGVIKDFRKHYYILEIMKLYEVDTCCRSTFYEVHDKLIQAGMIRIENNDLYINHYGFLFGKGQGGYIMLPEFIFLGLFKKLEIGAIKLALDWICKLDNKKGNYVYFSTRNELKQQRTNLKKRYDCEVKNLLEQLRQFFAINEDPDKPGVFSIALLWKFFIEKVQKKDYTENACEKYPRKTLVIVEVLESKPNIKYTPEDLQSFTWSLKKTNRRIIQKVFEILDKRLSYKKQRNETIDNLGGYVRTILDNEFSIATI